MAALTGQTIASSYEQILHVDNDGGGNSTTLVTVKDGDNGTTFALQLATDKVSTSGDLIIDADDKALVLGDDQDASIFSNAAGEIFFVRGQDYSPAAGDVEGWIAMTLGNSGDTYLNVMGGETGSAHLLLHSDGGDDDADKWKLTAVNDGGISFNYASTGSYVTHLKLDANSRISLSNNDGGSTSGVDSTTGNTIFGYLAGAAVDSDVINNTIFGHKAGNALNAGDGNTIIGSQTGDALTTGLNNTFIGREAGSATTDVDLAVCIGYGAGAAVMTGGGGADQTTAVGSSASASLTSGQANTAIGYSTLSTNQTSDFNTAIGHQSLQTLQVADLGRNTAVGINTLNALATGVENTVMGAFACDAMAVGESYNVAIGSDTMGAVDEGSGNANYNVAIGADALKGGDLGSNGDLIGNIAIGALALDATGTAAFTGAVAIGHQALTAQTADAQSVAIGYQTGLANQTGSKNVIIGYQAGITATDIDNAVLIGWKAGNAINANGGDATVAIGYEALNDLTSGEHNIAIGYKTLEHITTGTDNIAIGYQALGDKDHHSNCADSDHNLAIGTNALGGAWESNTSEYNVGVGNYTLDGVMNDANYNTAVGYAAGSAVTTADNGTFVGKYAGVAVTTGAANTGLGTNALATATSSTNNVAVGYRALSEMRANGDGNVAIGKDAIMGNILDEDVNYLVGIGNACLLGEITADASGTIAIGTSALAALTSGEGNIAVGYQAMDAMQEGHHNLAIGSGAFGTANNSGTDRNIAIGNYALDATSTNAIADCVAIGYAALGAVLNGSYNVGIGAYAGDEVTTGEANTIIGSYAMHNADGDEDHNTCIGYAAGDAIDDGNNNVIIGSVSDPSGATADNQIVIGKGATGVADNSVTLGNADVTAVYMAQDSGATVHCLDVKPTGGALKENLISNSGFGSWSQGTTTFINDQVTNGDFGSDASSWTAGRGATVAQVSTDGGRLRITNGGTTAGSAHQAASTVIGKWYRLKMDIKAASGVSNGYVRLATGAAGSGTMRIEHNAGAGDNHTRYYQAVATETVYVTCQVYSGSSGNYVEYDNVSFTEVVPACEDADNKGPDGWYKIGANTCKVYREQAGANTKDGEQYSLKMVTTNVNQYLKTNQFGTSSRHYYERFRGRTVTFGCWVKTSNSGVEIAIGDSAGETGSADHGGGGGWEWLELTKTFADTITHVSFMLRNTSTANTTIYFSQPIAVFGNSIGEGNYTRPLRETIYLDGECEVINTSFSTGTGSFDLEEDSGWKLPSGIQAIVNSRITVKDSGSSGANVVGYLYPGSGYENGIGFNIGNEGYTLANDDHHLFNSGYMRTVDAGMTYNFTASGSSTLDVAMWVRAIEV